MIDLKALRDVPPWEWPKGIGEDFLAVLRDRKAKASDRLLAAEFAGDFVVINDTLADALLAIVDDTTEPEKLRARAAVSFGPALEQGYIDEFIDPDMVPISEETFYRIQHTLQKVYADPAVPKFLRRRVLEAGVRAPEPWHSEAIRTAWAKSDPEWKLTAVFGMARIKGFDEQILEALESRDLLIRREAITAAGNWGIDAAWPHLVALLESEDTDKDLLLTAIEAAAAIRPKEAPGLLADLCDSEDEDIANAANEAVDMAEGNSGDDFDDEDDDDFDDEDDDDFDEEDDFDDEEDDFDDEEDDFDEEDEDKAGPPKTGR